MGIQYQGKTIKDVYYGGKRIYKGVQGSGAGTPKVFWDVGLSPSPVCFTSTQNDPFSMYCDVFASESITNGKFDGLRVSPGNTWSVPTFHYSNMFNTPALSRVSRVLIRSVDRNLRSFGGRPPALRIALKGSEGPITITGDLSSLVANPDESAFEALFMGGFYEETIGAVDASGLVFPDTFMCPRIYSQMFSACSSLVTAPVLPATTLANSCYRRMFNSCSSLLNAPELPATTLAQACYTEMFYECIRLVNAPTTLPATTLHTGSYEGMFVDCSSLKTAPEIHATTLAEYSCNNMFSRCTKLNNIKVHFTSWVENATNNWVAGVSSSGTFYKPSALPTKFGDSYIPPGWTVVNID